MSSIVIKRDGREKDVSELRVLNAVNNAYLSVYNGDTQEYMDEINNVVGQLMKFIASYSKEKIHVETIQDEMTRILKEVNPEVAKSAIKYRKKRDKARNKKQDKVFEEISQAILNDIVKDNGNMAGTTPAGQMMKYASEASKKYTLDNLLSEEVLEAYEDNILYIHDMDYYPTKSTTCLQHDLTKIFSGETAFGSHGEIRPPRRIESASFMVVLSLQTIQNEQHGGQSIPALDFMLAPYVKLTFEEELEKGLRYNGYKENNVIQEVVVKEYDLKEPEFEVKFISPITEENTGILTELVKSCIKATTKRVHQACESLIHNLNSIHSRGGNQVVFSSINYGTDTSAEGRAIIREMLNSTLRGVGKGSTPIFPIQIWKMKTGVNLNPGEPNYDLYKLAQKCTARRFYPNYINLDATYYKNDKWDENDPERWRYEAATMGCRTNVYTNRFDGSSAIARGNLSFSTLNIVKLGLLAKNKYENQEERIKYFFELLDKYMLVAKKQLLERFDFQCSADKSQFPTLMSGMWMNSEKDISMREILKHGTLSIGYIGLAETLVALIGKHHGESEEAQELGLRIIKHMRETCDRFSDEEDLNFTLLATPAEGLSGKFTKKDKVEFGIVEGVTDKDYYTNSNHVPVWYKIPIEDKIRIEAPYNALANAGSILYIELDGDLTKNYEVIEKICKLYTKYNVRYGAINIVVDRCLTCGYESTVNIDTCPNCGSDDIDAIARITGYLTGGVKAKWNSAKIEELRDRTYHNTDDHAIVYNR